MLRKRNYNIVPAESLAAALAAAAEAQFDLLISDIELPDGSGLELIHGLGDGRKLPAIAMSGFGSDEDVQLEHRCGIRRTPDEAHRLEPPRVGHPARHSPAATSPVRVIRSRSPAARARRSGSSAQVHGFNRG